VSNRGIGSEDDGGRREARSEKLHHLDESFEKVWRLGRVVLSNRPRESAPVNSGGEQQAKLREAQPWQAKTASARRERGCELGVT
jgi:hypothetical protein